MSDPATDPRTPSSQLSPEASAPVTHFVSKAPLAEYSVEERAKGGSPAVELCRVEKDGRALECVEIHERMTAVFALMQKQGFLCQLPPDPKSTRIQCQAISKLVERR